ncbi:MAG: hypothetical protein ABI399_07885, partial [Bauldia sp.]
EPPFAGITHKSIKALKISGNRRRCNDPAFRDLGRFAGPGGSILRPVRFLPVLPQKRADEMPLAGFSHGNLEFCLEKASHRRHKQPSRPASDDARFGPSRRHPGRH